MNQPCRSSSASPSHIRVFGRGARDSTIPTLAAVGGKAINLCRLTVANFPVPPGFVVTTDGYVTFVEQNQIAARIAQLAESIDENDTAQLDVVSAQIRALFTDRPMPASLAEEILTAYRQLRDAGGERVAVRSSATAEDLPEASFAGQQDTYLNIRGEAALLKAVQSCWGSLWTARAVAYRAKQDLASMDGLAMAVVVQQMVAAEAAGVMFTANPVTGAEDEIVINAAWGLGEAIVSGEVTPDNIIVEKATGKIKEIAVSEKMAMTLMLDDGTKEVELDEERRRARVLDDDHVARLAAIGRDIEQHYGTPQDIEWAVVQGTFAILQARPVRGIEVARDVRVGRREEIERLQGLCNGRRRAWIAHNLGETLRTPTPLCWDLVRRFMTGDGGFGRLYRDLGYRPSPQVCREGFLELIGGRIYADPDRVAQLFYGDSPMRYDLEALVKDPALLDQAPGRFEPERATGAFFLQLPGMIRAMLRASKMAKRLRLTVRDTFENDVLPPYLEYVAQKRTESLSGLETHEVCAELERRYVRVMDQFGTESLKPGFFGAMAFGDLRQWLIQLLGPEEGARLSSTLTMGLAGDSTVDQNQLLYRVARGDAPMDDFIGRYGHRTASEMELSEPRWRENLPHLQQTLLALRQSPRAPEEIHREHAQKRMEAERELPEVLARWGGSSFRAQIESSIAETQSLLAYRESGKHYLMMGYELLRMAILELGSRWNLGRDVFFLHADELARFESQPAELQDQLARRKIRWQALQRLDMADVLDSESLDQLGLPRHYESASQIKADPVAAGVATGVARIVFDPRESRDLGTDYILVCPSTDPGWTALFVNARGLVVERGGVLSHGAIVARDFGIPAVVCAGASSRLRDGDRICVDGNRGAITIVENASSTSQANKTC